ncbi:MAG: AAA family ATPase [Calditrichaeota bacterium]|nr:AAA family ATPase [Calditrichota bacterium]
MAITELSASKLRRHFNAKTFPFKTTDELTPLDSIIGQDRALKALQLGLEMDASGYNIFITGSPETGKTSIIENTLQRYAAKRNTPNDWCYVYNFGEQDVPRALSLPAGKGKVFRRHIADLINTLEIEIRRAFGSEHYENQKSAIMNQLNQQKRQMLQELEEKAIELSLKIQPTSMGFQTIPIKDGEPLTQEAFQGLSKDEREDITQKVQKMEVEISETLRNLARLEMRFQKSLQQLDKDVASFVVEQYVNEIKGDLQKAPASYRLSGRCLQGCGRQQR